MPEAKTILVTGATGSIGRATARALARRGHRVVLAGRKRARLEREIDGIQTYLERCAFEPGTERLSTLLVDFADFDSVQAAAARALERFARIDGLVLSVGAFLQGGPRVLANGHEAMFAANVLGPFLFTELLMPRLVASTAVVAHVVAPFQEKLDWDDLESLHHHRAMKAFNRTKVCDRMMVGELARRHGDGITSVAFDPSFVIDRKDADLKKRWPKGLQGLGWSMAARFGAKSPETAGEPLAELVTLTRHRRPINGARFKLYERVAATDAAMEDAIGGRRLWKELAQRVGLAEPSTAPARPLVGASTPLSIKPAH